VKQHLNQDLLDQLGEEESIKMQCTWMSLNRQNEVCHQQQSIWRLSAQKAVDYIEKHLDCNVKVSRLA
jgi:hypothetical protein